jgi:DNA adenine methylase
VDELSLGNVICDADVVVVQCGKVEYRSIAIEDLVHASAVIDPAGYCRDNLGAENNMGIAYYCVGEGEQ